MHNQVLIFGSLSYLYSRQDLYVEHKALICSEDGQCLWFFTTSSTFDSHDQTFYYSRSQLLQSMPFSSHIKMGLVLSYNIYKCTSYPYLQSGIELISYKKQSHSGITLEMYSK